MTEHKDFNFLKIFWDDEARTVIMQWNRFAKDQDFRNGLDEGLKLLKNKSTHRWLADLRNLGTVTKEDQEWSNNDWYPRAIRDGIRDMAIIMPQSVLSTMSVKNILQKVSGVEISTQYFDEVQGAREWLMGK